MIEKIQNDIKAAMLARDQLKLSTLRMLKSAIKNLEIDNPTKTLSSEDILAVIQKQIKQRRDSIEEFEKAGRNELADKEKKEEAVLAQYLPKQMSDQELMDIVNKVVTENEFTNKKNFGHAMKLVQAAASGQADNKRISNALNGVLT